MRKQIYTLIVFLSIIGPVASQVSITVMSYNIRLNLASDSLDAWPYRENMLSSQILFHKVDLLGVQEALPGQMEDLKQRLPHYKTVGGGRDDGKQKGEHSAIFFDSSRFKSLAWDMFWLSGTPSAAGSKGWDAAFPRIVTWAKLQDIKTGKICFAFNTHFDHMGKIARAESAKLLLQKIQEIAGNLPSVITGDFNAKPADEPIQLITDPSNPLHLNDAKSLSQAPHYGPTGTFNGFTSKETSDQPIDYIFIKGNWKVLSHATLSQTWQGRFASDHFAVIAELVL